MRMPHWPGRYRPGSIDVIMPGSIAVRRLGHRLADALRAFVHVEEVADAVAGAVAVVELGGPQRRARQRVEHRRQRAAREARPAQRQRALQHAGVVLAMLRRDVADRPDARDVGGAAQVLAAGVDQQQAVALDRRRATRALAR